MKIKTLAEILAESDTDSASTADSKPTKPLSNTHSSKKSVTDTTSKYSNKKQLTKKLNTASESSSKSSDSTPSSAHLSEKPSKSNSSKSKKRKKRFHPAASFEPESKDIPTYQAPEAQSIQEILAEVKRDVHNQATNDEQTNSSERQTETDNLPSALKAYLRTPEQKQAEIDAIKAESRLRWLAFYYLSRREYGKAELKQKLIDKEQDPDKIDALLDEFSDKGYQSDYRTTLMLIRENIRKGRGRERIKQEFYKKKIAMPSNIDELIDMANNESDEFSEFVAGDENSLVDGVDWLRLAVEARTKKYGDSIPTEPKEKARQLRFLQYRGFKSDICFAALNYTLDTLDERF
ncbi:regulatory protein RecX [uncultured Psychrobacter sp.]|uniref:regulatory protein RecX n=1 Tax=uncultured Psychrobacter sp. TaxID=259303 RepID=UPI003458867A